MQAGFLRLFACRERDEKEELPLEFSLRILLNPRMLSCSLNLLQCQFDGAASIAALLRCVKNAGWVVGEQIFLHTQEEEGKQLVSPEVRSAFALETRKGPRREAVDIWLFPFSFLRAVPISSCCALCRLPTAILSCC